MPTISWRSRRSISARKQAGRVGPMLEVHLRRASTRRAGMYLLPLQRATAPEIDALVCVDSPGDVPLEDRRLLQCDRDADSDTYDLYALCGKQGGGINHEPAQQTDSCSRVMLVPVFMVFAGLRPASAPPTTTPRPSWWPVSSLPLPASPISWTATWPAKTIMVTDFGKFMPTPWPTRCSPPPLSLYMVVDGLCSSRGAGYHHVPGVCRGGRSA